MQMSPNIINIFLAFVINILSILPPSPSLGYGHTVVQGQAWADSAAKTDTQENWEAQRRGARGSPSRTCSPSRMRNEMPPDVKDGVLRRILLFYKIALPKG